jgi:uncharacterized membrane protein YhiD involved in acid resistance
MDLTAPAPLSLTSYLLNLGLAIILSLLVAWYYVRFGESLSNRRKFAPNLPFLALITVLVISVVKSSLALSLGLVGALSIVRFRTAIKDPEELMFLFLAIAIGLGLGADQRIATVVAVLVILAYLLVRARNRIKKKSSHSLYLNINVESDGAGGKLFKDINELILEETTEVDIRRLDNQDNNLQATYYLAVHDQETIVNLMESLRGSYPGISISIVEQNNMLGG